MKIYVQLLLLVWLIKLLLCVWAAAAAAADECRRECGNITVPFPFGIGDDKCFKNQRFNLTCDDTANPPVLHRYRGNIPILKISVENATATVNIPMAYACYNQSGFSEYIVGLNLRSNNPFTLSATQNKFIGTGCDTVALMKGFNGEPYLSGCISSCDSPVNVTAQGSCSGIGCCQTPIPKDVEELNISFSSFNGVREILDFNPCSFAFLADQNWFDFSKIDLSYYPENKIIESQVVFDWFVKNETCESAQRSGDPARYACGLNSNCLNYDKGYRCECKEGYKGNPYLIQGCEDIDECSEPTAYPCQGTCKNTLGNYTCRCPLGMRGDGKQGCRGLRLTVLATCISLGVGLLFLPLASMWLYQVLKKRRNKIIKEKMFKLNGGLLLEQQISSTENRVEKTKIFNAEELEKATDHYNENRILGQGGQGTVYKGMLADGKIVAIKKPKTIDEGQLKQFINDVIILSQINHRNVVKLLGCCLETKVPLLVYEFISNKTLFHHLHHQSEEFPMSWDNRLRIATEVAGALAYLHTIASMPIYHRDVKSTNILLDDKYRAKVSNFGTYRSVPTDKTHITTLVQGTVGYLDPEYFQSNEFTDKSDVYSFGVVLAELLTGEKPISLIGSRERRNLATYFIQSIDKNRLFEILDVQVMEGQNEELEVVASLAKRCLNLNGKKRPTMKEVATKLAGLRMSPSNLPTEINHHEDEVITDLSRPRETGLTSTSNSTTTGCGNLENSVSYESDTQPLVFNISSYSS